ncbi:hypothetical protein [Pseudomonas aeruginosa]|uniref:hypothetical protein n=1 Tax=Pseudomonas aeruginosa TaxID=287 RepID=UPI0020C5C720|nr:hypothetical protein [Pseudomonas aeruginosa]UTL98251.1 hypothetical protein NLS69_07440 [Pseudomonas aeruginosa]
MSNCPHEAWDFGAIQCPDCGAVKDHVTDAEYAKLAAEAKALREEVAALRVRGLMVSERLVQGMAKFAREIICGALEGGSFDGADI